MTAKRVAPPSIRTTLLIDAMYFHAANQSYDQALRHQKGIEKAERVTSRLNERRDRILATYENDHWEAYDDLEPIYIQMESADYGLGMAYGPFLQSLASVHILCAASLESHINTSGREHLSQKHFELFERFSLEAKWITFPKLLGLAGFDPGTEPFQGFSRLVRFRNVLIHYKGRIEDWQPPGVPSFLNELGLTETDARRSLETVKGIITKLAKQFGEDEPFWLRHKGDISYFEVVVK